MSWSGAIAAIKTNAETAAADVTPAITDVRIGEPDVLTQDTIGIWPIGTRPSQQTGGRSLSLIFVERGVLIRVYLRGAIRAGAIDETLEARLVAIEEALYTRLYADASCGDNADDLHIEAGEYSWEQFGAGPSAQLARTLSLTVWLEMPAIATLAR